LHGWRQDLLHCHDYAGDAVILGFRINKLGVVKDLYARFCEHFICNDLEAFCLEWGDVNVTLVYVRGESGFGFNLGRMYSAADGNESLNELLKKTADEHLVAAAVIAGHKGSDHTCGSHTSAKGILFNKDDLCAASRRSNSRAKSRGTAADNDNIPLERIGYIITVNKFFHISASQYFSYIISQFFQYFNRQRSFINKIILKRC
jgi:hypothetical protein